MAFVLVDKLSMNELTPVLLVEQIEPCLPFWVDRLGFQKISEVADGNRLGFVILAKAGVQIMYQTRLSAAKDIGVTSDKELVDGPLNPRKDAVILYIHVEELDLIIDALKGVAVVVPKRKTSYGATEYGVREPGGTVILFAEFAY